MKRRRARKYINNVRSLTKKNIGGKLTGGRETTPLWQRGFFISSDMPIRRAPHREKNVLDTLKFMRDINPDASMAVWNFLRLANQGHDVEVFNVNGEPDEEMQQYINDELAPRMGEIYAGGTDQLVNVLNLTGFTEGAEALEVELNETLDDVADFHAISPSKLDFRPNAVTGKLELVEKQLDGTFKVLNSEQVFYVPIDPDIDDPYGRSPMLPAIQAIIFQTEVLKDLKAVAHHQGHARFDISVSSKAIVDNLPDSILNQGEDAVNEFIDTYMNGVEQAFENLEPDDDFYHADTMTVTTVGGTSGKSMDSKSLIDIINQQVVTSLKQLPILMGRNESTTETHGKIQMEIYTAGVQSIQNVTKRLLEKAYTVALRVKGSQSSVKITFNAVQTKDRKAEADAESIEINNAIAKVNQGWIDNNAAANALVGHDAVSEPKQQMANYPLSSLMKPNTEPTETDEEGRMIRKFPSKTLFGKEGSRQEVDEFILEMNEPWSEVVAKMSIDAQEDISALLARQCKTILDLIEDAENPPEILKNQRLDEPEDFDKWLKENVIDNELEIQFKEDFEPLLREWIFKTVLEVGRINLLTILPDTYLGWIDDTLMEWVNWRAEFSAIEIVGTTRDAISKVLFDVVADGPWSIDKATEAIQESHTFSDSRARVIARTELLTSQTTGQFASDLDLYDRGLLIGKEWHTTRDDRARHSHKEADGQIKEFLEPFVVGGELLMHPRDSEMGASAKNVIQCRCFYTRILVGQEDKMK